MYALGEGSDKANEDNRERASLDFSLHDIKGWEGLWKTERDSGKKEKGKIRNRGFSYGKICNTWFLSLLLIRSPFPVPWPSLADQDWDPRAQRPCEREFTRDEHLNTVYSQPKVFIPAS